jgi:hypothetical protein
MSFDKFEAHFVTENTKLKLLLVAAICIYAIGICVTIGQKKYYLYRGGAIFEERPLAEEICRLGFDSLASGAPHPYVVSDKIIKLVKQEPFKLAVEKVLSLRSAEKDRCRIVLKSEGRLIAFDILLSANDSNPFHYKVAQLDEIAVGKGTP